MKCPLIVLAGLLLCLARVSGQGGDFRGCFFTNWSQYRPGIASFFPEDIDPTLCSHIIYAFADMVGNRLVPIEWNDFDLYARVNALKDAEPDLKTLLCVGGATFALSKMSAMLSTEANRAEFIQYSIIYLRQHGFDGLDMNFQFPGDTSQGSVPEDRELFTVLCQEMRVAYDMEAEISGRTTLLMTSTVAAGNDTIEMAYEIDLLAQELDYISIMTYNLHGSWEDFTGGHTALYPRVGEDEDQIQLNVEFAAQYWVDGGAPANKLVLGMATYGQGYTLLDPGQTGMGAPSIFPSPPGPYTNSPGMYAYYEVCTELLDQGAIVEWHDEHKVPYAHLGYTWCSYDDEQAFHEKIDFLTTGGYAGWMIWALDLDDFNDSHCGEGPYPLLNILNDASNKK